MAEHAGKPKVRFAGFTETWEQRKFEKIAIRSSAMAVCSRSLPGVEYEDIISEHGILNKDIKTKRAVKIGIKFLPGDVLFGKLRPYLKNWLLPDFTGVAVGDFWVLQPSEIDSQYLYYLIQTPAFQEVSNQSTGTKMPRADWNLVANSMFFLPQNDDEQTCIGTFFRQLDRLITLHQRKRGRLENIKKAMLEKMFPKNGADVPEIRFAGFTEAWEQRKLGEIADKVTEKNTTLRYTEALTNSAEFGIIGQRDFFDHDVAKLSSLHGYYIVKEDDFVYNPRISVTAPVGPVNRNKLGKIGVVSPLYTVLRTAQIDNEFLEWFFKSACWHSFMIFNGDSGARSDRFSIKNSTFFEMPIPCPCRMEQVRIGTFFRHLDRLITLHQRKVTLLQNIKKACLEKMFV